MRPDALTKLALTFFCIVCALTAPWVWNFLLFGSLVTVGIILSLLEHTLQSKERRIFWKFLAYIGVFICLITILNGVLLRNGRTIAGPLGISFFEGGLEFGLKTAARLSVLSSSLLLFFLMTPLREFIEYLQQLGFPSSLVTILFLTLHFLGKLPERIQQIFIAQEARGAPVRATALRRTQAFFLILSPLILSSIVETIERGAALEVRGFRGELRSVQSLPLPMQSVIIATALFIASLSLIFWRIF